jgi:hypothetical protein
MAGRYQSKNCEIDGYHFDSQGEARRYQELVLMYRAGQISNLIAEKMELRYPIEINGVKIGYYEADFRYWDNEKQQEVIEDYKSEYTAKNDKVSKLKRDIVGALYGIKIQVVIG